MTRARDLGDFIADGGTPELVVDTTTLVVDSTNNRVGVGTTSPIYAADIKTSGTNNGQLRVGGASTSATGLLLEQTNSGTTTANIQNSYYATSADASLSIKSGVTTFHTGTSGTERMRIDSSGVVNVGTASGTQPSYFNSFLNVQNNGSTGSHASVTITSGSGGFAGLHFGDSDNGRIGQVTYNNSDNSLLLTANNSERFRIASAGQLGIAGANYGTSGQVLTSGGSGAAPSWADAAGGGTLEFTASENLAAGDVLVLDNSNGQVGKVTVTASFGSVTRLGTAQVVYYEKHTYYDATNGVMFGIYKNETINYYRYWSIKDGETAFTATSNNVVNEACNKTHTAYDPVQNTFLHVYRRGTTSYYRTSIPNTSNRGYLTVSSESSLPFNIGGSPQMASCYDSDSGKIILIFRDDNDSNITKYVVATCSGNSASFGSVGTVTNNAIGTGSFERHSDATYDDTANRVLFLFRSSSTANSTRCVAGSVSGTTVTWGTDTQLDGGANYALSIMYDSVSGKNLVVYGDGSKLQSRVLTLSGSTISTGSETTIASSFAAKGTDIYFNSATQQINVAGSNHSGDLNVYSGTISGTAWSSSGSSVGLYSGNAQNPHGAYNSNDGRGYVFYTDADASDNGKVAYFSSSSNNASNFIGIAAATISSGSSGKVTLFGGVNENVTGLTIGSTYYVSIGGGLSTVDNGTKVGKAVAANKILISGGA